MTELGYAALGMGLGTPVLFNSGHSSTPGCSTLGHVSIRIWIPRSCTIIWLLNISWRIIRPSPTGAVWLKSSNLSLDSTQVVGSSAIFRIVSSALVPLGTICTFACCRAGFRALSLLILSRSRISGSNITKTVY